MAGIVVLPQDAPKKLPMGKDEQGNTVFYNIYTKNISFLQTSSDLKRLGIKNNMFFLKLYNRDLLDIDPYSPNLTSTTIKALVLEMMMNPYFFWREVARIPEDGGSTGPGSGAPFILHRGNLASMFCFLHNIDHYLVISRQCFKTHSTLSELLWAYLLGTTNSTFNFVNKTQTDSDQNLEKLKKQKEVLPIWLQQRYSFVEDEYSLDDSSEEKKIFKGMDNVRRILNPVTKNTILSKPSARTEAAADGIGRGNSAAIQLYDEVEFCPYIGTILAASGPAYVRSAEIAERNNAPHCRILTSTPGNIDSEPVESSKDTRENAAPFTENLYDMTSEEIKNWMDIHSKNGMVYIQFNYRQIGMGSKYFNKMVAVLEHNKIKIKREILLQRIRGSSESPFDEDDLDIINDNAKDPIKEILILRKYVLNVYRELDKNIHYIIGVDCSHGYGVGSDNTAVVVIDPYDQTAVACLVTSYADAVESAKMLTELVNVYIPNGLLCIERNNLGSAIIAILGNTNMVNKMYYDANKIPEADAYDKLDKKGYVDTKSENKRYWGVSTTVKTRAIMTEEILTYRVKEFKSTFICKELIQDLNDLIMKSSGKIEARSGCHDDVVMAYCIGMYVYTHGVGLTKWGIIKGQRKEWIEKKEKGTLTYKDIYNSLPDDIKDIFPSPDKKDNRLELIPKENELDKIKSTDSDLYEQIQAMQNSRARRSKVVISEDGDTEVIVKDTYDTNSLIDQAANPDEDISDDIIDICNLLNE